MEKPSSSLIIPLVLDGAVSGPLLSAAQGAVAALCEVSSESDTGEEEACSLCTTRWVPLTQGPGGLRLQSQARNACEETIAHLGSLGPVLEALGDWEAIVGAEWWLQEQGPGDEPKELHTDKDVYLDSASGSTMTRNPWRASVLYLSETGGPTAVFDQRKAGFTLAPPLPVSAHVAFPQPGRFLMFSGELLHGVLHAASSVWEPTEKQPRRTLLINWWREKPVGASPACPRTLPRPMVVLNSEEGHAAQPCALRRLERPCFLDDAPAWRQQRLPQALLLQALLEHGDLGPPLLINYPPDVPKEVLEMNARGLDWTDVDR